MSYEQKYLKYKSKYLQLKKSMHGGVIYSGQELEYKRTDIILPETLTVGNSVQFMGTLSFNNTEVGGTKITYFILENADSSENQTVKIDVTIILFDGTIYKFVSESTKLKLKLKSSTDSSLAPYDINTTLKLSKNSNGEKDVELNYNITAEGTGKFTLKNKTQI